MKVRILQPKNMKITVNETTLTHFFNYVMKSRFESDEIDFKLDPRMYLRELRHHEMENWKVQLLEDMIRGTIQIKDNE